MKTLFVDPENCGSDIILTFGHNLGLEIQDGHHLCNGKKYFLTRASLLMHEDTFCGGLTIRIVILTSL